MEYVFVCPVTGLLSVHVPAPPERAGHTFVTGDEVGAVRSTRYPLGARPLGATTVNETLDGENVRFDVVGVPRLSVAATPEAFVDCATQ
jgi:hypothetical protein